MKLKLLFYTLVLALLILTASCGSDEPSIPNKIVQNSIYYNIDGDEAVVVEYTGNESSLTIPSIIKVNLNNQPKILKVKAIDEGVFCDCRSLENVIIEDGIEYIQDEAFKGCLKLRNITLPTTLKYIGDFAFSETAIKNINIPSGSFGSHILHGAPLSSLHLGAGVKKIPNKFFDENIGGLGSTSLAKVTFSEGLEEIGYSAFKGCSHITEIIIPSSTTVINNAAFQNNVSLAKVVFGSGIKSIGDDAFNNCNIKTYYFKGQTPPTIQGYLDAFFCDIYVPQVSVTLYEQALQNHLSSSYYTIHGY